MDAGKARRRAPAPHTAAADARGTLIPLTGAIFDAALRLRGGDNGDAVHDLRVACRRLEGALWLWAPVLDARAARALRDRARRLRRRLSRARDAEVEWAMLRALRAKPAGAAGRRIARWLGRGRDLRRRRLERAAEFVSERRLQRLEEAARTVGAAKAAGAADAHSGGVGPAVDDALALVGRRLGSRAAEVRRAAGGTMIMAGARLHRLRIAIKKCRYAIESWQVVTGAPAPLALEPLALAQRRLGHLRDAELLLASLSERARRWRARGRSTEARWAAQRIAALSRQRLADWRAFGPERSALLGESGRRRVPAARSRRGRAGRRAVRFAAAPPTARAGPRAVPPRESPPVPRAS